LIKGDIKSNAIKFIFRDYWMFIILIFFVAIFTIFGSRFLSIYNLQTIVVYNTEIMLLAIGELFIIIMAHIDLSVGSVLAISGIVGSIVMRSLYSSGFDPIFSTLIGFLTGLGIGLLCGFINGLLISRIRVPSFVVTLGMLGIARGIVYVITNGSAIMNLPPFLEFVGMGFIFKVLPIITFIAILVSFIAGFLLQRTKFGRYLYIHGGNKESAIRVGININDLTLKAFMFSGLLAGLAGMLLCARFLVGSPVMGQGRELDAIAAVVIGGASLYGGKGGVFKTIIGAFIISVLRVGLVNIGVHPYWQMIAVGCILIMAVYVDQLQSNLS